MTHDYAVDQDVFQEALACYVRTYADYYGDRLVSVYVWGSVSRGEAVAGISDLDLMIITRDGFTSLDEQWELSRWHGDDVCAPFGIKTHPTRSNTAEALYRGLYPTSEDSDNVAAALSAFVRGGVVSDLERATIKPGTLARCIHYDATLAFGRDIVGRAPCPIMDAAWGAYYLDWPYKIIRKALSTGDACVAKTANTQPDWRKLARLAVQIGDCFLMAKARFISFRVRDVVPSLIDLFPSWSPFLVETRQMALNEMGAPFDQELYGSELLRWSEWVKEAVHSQRNGS